MKRRAAFMIGLLGATLTTQHALSIGRPDENPPVQNPAKHPNTPKAVQAPPYPEYPEMLDKNWIETRGVPCKATGIVAAIGKDSLTLTFLPERQWVCRPDQKGQMIFVEVAPLPAPPPKTFKLSSLLAAGKASAGRGAEWSYGIADVRVGDWVELCHHTRPNGIDCCDNIRITRRPGGKIPPAPGEKEGNKPYRYHEKAQAHQDFLEKGMPIPDKFLPESQRKIAPMPHEVKTPRIPSAEP
jgi:hypothetical protein